MLYQTHLDTFTHDDLRTLYDQVIALEWQAMLALKRYHAAQRALYGNDEISTNG